MPIYISDLIVPLVGIDCYCRIANSMLGFLFIESFFVNLVSIEIVVWSVSLCSIEHYSHDVVGVYAILNKRTIPMINESVELSEARFYFYDREKYVK